MILTFPLALPQDIHVPLRINYDHCSDSLTFIIIGCLSPNIHQTNDILVSLRTILCSVLISTLKNSISTLALLLWKKTVYNKKTKSLVLHHHF